METTRVRRTRRRRPPWTPSRTPPHGAPRRRPRPRPVRPIRPTRRSETRRFLPTPRAPCSPTRCRSFRRRSLLRRTRPASKRRPRSWRRPRGRSGARRPTPSSAPRRVTSPSWPRSGPTPSSPASPTPAWSGPRAEAGAWSRSRPSPPRPSAHGGPRSGSSGLCPGSIRGSSKFRAPCSLRDAGVVSCSRAGPRLPATLPRPVLDGRDRPSTSTPARGRRPTDGSFGVPRLPTWDRRNEATVGSGAIPAASPFSAKRRTRR